MNKIYLVEEVRYKRRSKYIIEYDCIESAWDIWYYEDLKEAEERLKKEWLLNDYKDRGFILHEIRSIKDYNTIEEFLEEFQEHGNDEENFFMEHLREFKEESECDEECEEDKIDDIPF